MKLKKIIMALILMCTAFSVISLASCQKEPGQGHEYCEVTQNGYNCE